MKTNKQFIETKVETIWATLLEKNIKTSDNIAIIGGNSLLSTDNEKEDPTLKVNFEFQVFAFEIALALSEKIKEFGAKSTITLVIDHSIDFRIFLGLEPRINKRGEEIKDSDGNTLFKRVPQKPRRGHFLSHLNREILKKFSLLLIKYQKEATEIRLLFEVQCRSKIKTFWEEERFKSVYPQQLLNTMIKEEKENCFINFDRRATTRVTASCKGITSHCISKAVKHSGDDANFFVGIWGKDEKRCNPDIINGGTEIAEQVWLADKQVKTLNFFLNEQEENYKTSFFIQNHKYNA